MFNRFLFGAILLTNLVHANINRTCYECSGCKSTPKKTSTDNRLCFRIQADCPAADIHVIDLTGDRPHSNYSSTNCGQTLSYSSTCTITYHCCYTDRCNTYENLILSSSSSLFLLNRIVIFLTMLLISHNFF